MRWFQLFKTHNFINDMDKRLDAHGNATLDLMANASKLKAQADADREEALAAIAADSESMDGRISDRLEAATKALDERMAAVEAAAAGMLKDAEEIKRAVERIHRREGEFTSMIDQRCRAIGGKINEEFGAGIQKAADRAVAAAAEAQLVLAKAEASFTEKLGLHARATDRKVNLLAEKLGGFETKAEDKLREIDAALTAARALRTARPSSSGRYE